MARESRVAMIRTAATGVVLLALAVAAAAQEAPPFRKGLWEFTRTVEGTGQPKNTVARKVCTSPNEDMRRGREQSPRPGAS